jgi:hypothetical protein
MDDSADFPGAHQRSKNAAGIGWARFVASADGATGGPGQARRT